VLPQGTGKSVRVAVFDDAKVEGADISGVEAITKALEKGEVAFDILIATPANMPKLGKYARLLGPRGLMPNPKSGTVTTDVTKAVQEAKAGRVEYRVDSTGIVHVAIGKVSFGATKLEENARAVLQSIKGNKPASVKGAYVKAIHLATTMGPSVTIDTAEL
jgi:large subunit ribosomal protein L1